jgi:non-ribosomal peptide synthetase component F
MCAEGGIWELTSIRACSGSSPFSSENLVDAFSATVEKYPDRQAVRCGGESLSYRRLDLRVTALAQAILARVPLRDQPIALLLNRSVDMVAAALAVLKTGN